MTVETKTLELKTEGENDIIDISANVQHCIKDSRIKNGIAVIFCPGSTGAITTMEYEPGLKKDIPGALERIAPKNVEYAHHLTWGDSNGSGHVKSSIIGPSLTLPFTGGKLLLGQWQQVVFMECDTRSRRRQLIIQIVGD